MSINQPPTPVKRYRGRSVDHCGDPLLRPLLRGRCWDCVRKEQQIARLIADLAIAQAEIAALHELVDTAAQMAVDEGPEVV